MLRISLLEERAGGLVEWGEREERTKRITAWLKRTVLAIMLIIRTMWKEEVWGLVLGLRTIARSGGSSGSILLERLEEVEEDIDATGRWKERGVLTC